VRTRTWETQDGQKHYRPEIIANRVIFLDRRGAAPLPEEKVEEGGAGEMEPEPGLGPEPAPEPAPEPEDVTL